MRTSDCRQLQIEPHTQGERHSSGHLRRREGLLYGNQLTPRHRGPHADHSAAQLHRAHRHPVCRLPGGNVVGRLRPMLWPARVLSMS